ncbi:MAG: DUF4173 domain-containing protein [Bacteroidales bacterium]|jgi:hypothetical protein|nr:DUF4173 domain-containing protein [Bacteroidales bacterium]
MRIRKKYLFLLNVLFTVIFVVFFFKNHIALNLVLFELLVIPLMLYLNKPLKFNYLTITVLASLIISAFFVIFINSEWTIFINAILLIISSAALSFKSIQSFLNLSVESFVKIFSSQIRLLTRWHKPKFSNNISLKKIFLFIILPFLFLVLFVGLYAWASDVFYNKIAFILDSVVEFFEKIGWDIILYLIFGFLLGNVLFLASRPSCLYKKDLNASFTLSNISPDFDEKTISNLKLENLSGIIILALLNLLILFFNVVDINEVWLNFNFEGETLGNFVHKGTYVLIFAIILSGGIALFFFRNKLNFFKNNLFIKILSIVWIFQNFIMTFSVIVRNYYYIENFGLTYKRIALLFFLGVTMLGLLSIVLKIILKKNTHFLLAANSYIILLAFVVSSFFNWDIIIAKYNLENYQQNMIDVHFMSKLDDSALPYLYKTEQEVENIKSSQEKLSEKYPNNTYLWRLRIKSLSFESYYKTIEDKKMILWNNIKSGISLNGIMPIIVHIIN